jgi:hypothetical protein
MPQPAPMRGVTTKTQAAAASDDTSSSVSLRMAGLLQERRGLRRWGRAAAAG